MKYCALCETEATHIIEQSNMPICFTCKTAYECGQASPDNTFDEVKDEDEKA